MELLRFVTSGNVDDGKSTLIGRLLYDSRSLFDDQLAALGSDLNLALVTDGLRDEREQGITIDVAYRYFNTPKRKFIVADCPGHVQYTRNMVTGASQADLAVLLIDARKGLTEQTRRHSLVASLMRTPHLVVCINKMDLVDYSLRVYDNVRSEFTAFSEKLEIPSITFIPVSALIGDNVATATTQMAWYDGRSLLGHLEKVHVNRDWSLSDFRFPVQNVITPSDATHGRRYAGMIASGSIQTNDDVIVLPSGLRSRVKSIEHSGKEVKTATYPLSITLQLEDELDLKRGDLIARPSSEVQVDQDIEADICWLGNSPLKLDRRYLLKHTTSEVEASVQEVIYKFDINTLSRITEDGNIKLNDFARVRIRTHRPLSYDPYRRNRSTGGFILISKDDFATVAAGMIS